MVRTLLTGLLVTSVALGQAVPPLGSAQAPPSGAPSAPALPPPAAAPPPTAPASPPPAPVSAPPAPNPNLCTPSCRTGYMCVERQCISACNPVCGVGETCNARGECERPLPDPGASVRSDRGPSRESGDGERPDPGWAIGGGVFGIIAGVGAIGLAVGSEVTKDEQIPSLPLGIAATGLIAIAGPVTALGGGSARGGGVRGAPGLRVAGWLGYALTLLDASVLIGLGVNEIEPTDGLITSVGLLGASSLMCLSADAFISASEAERAAVAQLPAGSTVATPVLSVARAKDGTLIPTFGVAGAF